MRIRSTKPEFWRSERIASVSWDARLVLKGLESYVDDNGVGKDDLALIVGDLFQRDLVREPSRTLARVSEAISELCDAGLLHRYDVDGTPLLYVSFWESIQRVDKPQAGRFPRPDGTKNYKDSEIRESVANIREPSRALAPGTGEQGNRGTDSPPPANAAGDTRADDPDPFDEFWKHYPRKVEKQDARKAWRSALKKTTASELIDAVKAYPFGTDPQFVKHAATWLNKGCWADEPTNVRPINDTPDIPNIRRDIPPWEDFG